ncbi:MAG: hypothetical protein KAS73_08315 [Candidatus Sabulitectum sp.]|nr:hypothetical protein [Candidatus Sabulitectum sp.]
MICPDRNTLMTWCDKEIASPEADTISEHIKHCESCKAFTVAQKQMESVWRDSWKDPGEASFKKMRSNIKHATPWWRTQRTWFIAAALCAAYIGVKVFYIDGTGASLSSIALEETSVPVQITSGDLSDPRDESPLEEMEEAVAVEVAEEEIEFLQDELVSGQSEIPEVVEELSVDLALSVSDSGVSVGDAEMEVMEEDADLISGSPEVVLNAVGGHHNVESQDMAEPPGTVDESLEQESVFRTAGSISSESAGSGMVEGALSGGVGGGGSTAYGSVGMSPAPVTEDQCDDLVEDVHSDLPAQSETPMITYSVLITLESKEIIQIQRFQWNSLFAMIDALQEENWNPSAEMLVFTVSSEGIIAGDNAADGAVIAVPETGYGDCVVTVHFF